MYFPAILCPLPAFADNKKALQALLEGLHPAFLTLNK
jgi:hypothetical protein